MPVGALPFAFSESERQQMGIDRGDLNVASIRDLKRKQRPAVTSAKNHFTGRR